MSFDVFLVVASVSGFLAATLWLQKRSDYQLQFQKQQAQFWSKVMAGNATTK